MIAYNLKVFTLKNTFFFACSAGCGHGYKSTPSNRKKSPLFFFKIHPEITSLTHHTVKGIMKRFTGWGPFIRQLKWLEGLLCACIALSDQPRLSPCALLPCPRFLSILRPPAPTLHTIESAAALYRLCCREPLPAATEAIRSFPVSSTPGFLPVLCQPVRCTIDHEI